MENQLLDYDKFENVTNRSVMYVKGTLFEHSLFVGKVRLSIFYDESSAAKFQRKHFYWRLSGENVKFQTGVEFRTCIEGLHFRLLELDGAVVQSVTKYMRASLVLEGSTRQIESMILTLNKTHSNIQFKLKHKEKSKINFLLLKWMESSRLTCVESP